MAHASLFAPMDRLPFWQATAWCAQAAGWDVVISVAAYAAAALAVRRALWSQHPMGDARSLFPSLGRLRVDSMCSIGLRDVVLDRLSAALDIYAFRTPAREMINAPETRRP